MRINGKVVEDVFCDEEESKYSIQQDGKRYEIISRGLQAIKDYLFVRKGQSMIIDGNPVGEVVYVEKAHVMLTKESEENYEYKKGK